MLRLFKIIKLVHYKVKRLKLYSRTKFFLLPNAFIKAQNKLANISSKSYHFYNKKFINHCNQEENKKFKLASIYMGQELTDFRYKTVIWICLSALAFSPLLKS